MDDSWDEEPTQPATQLLPPHNGVAPSDNSGQDYRGVICFLHPCSSAAIAIVHRARTTNSGIAVRLPVPTDSTRGRRAPQDNHSAGDDEDPSTQVNCDGVNTAIDLALRREPGPKDHDRGFIFGRNPSKCDILMVDHPNNRRISNTHFRIFVNPKGALMLEDLSTNGTWVDGKFLSKNGNAGRMRVLSPGSIILLSPGMGDDEVIRFVVRIPKDTGRGLKSGRLPDDNLSLPGSPGPPPNVGLPRVGGVGPGVVQTPQQRNAAAILRNPIRHPEEQHHRQTAGLPASDMHTDCEPSGNISWCGDHRYSLAGQIGKGAFATVNKAYEKTTGNVVAVKSIAKRAFATQIGKEKNTGVKKEIDILERLSHPNIVEYIEYLEDNTHIYVIMEYIEHGDLNNYLHCYGVMPEKLTKQVTVQVLCGLGYIHKMGISHRDLKPDNILIASEAPLTIKISDFGLAKMVNNEETFLRTFCGTMLYLAPEVFPGYMDATQAEQQRVDGKGKRKRPRKDVGGPEGKTKHRRPYSQAVDMWSLGCVIYCLLCGSPPFEGKNQEEMCRMVNCTRFDEARLRAKVGMDNDACVDFLAGLLQIMPENRMMETEALRHEWIYEKAGSTSMEDDDEVLGVDYAQNQQGRHQEENDEDRDEQSDKEPEKERFNSGDEKLLTRHPEKSIDKELQGGMARVSFGQPEEVGWDLLRSSDNQTSSGNECFESLVNSRQEFSQGNTGISVIDRARAEARNQANSSQGSSGGFPDETAHHVSESREEEEEGDAQILAHHMGGAFEFMKGQPKEMARGEQVANAEARADQLAAATDPPPPCGSSPPRPLKDGISIRSPFSFANNANFNFTPESLKNQSRRQSLAAPKLFTNRITNPEDEGLASIQTACSQEPSNPGAQPTPWGRLSPLPGSLAHDPIALTDQLVTFGRAASCTIKPADMRISKFHFAMQMNYPNRDRQTNPAQSRVEEWKPDSSMVVVFQAPARCGVLINGCRYEIGRLYDGDEIILFKESVQGKIQFLGYRAELTIGDVKRRGPPFTGNDIGAFSGGVLIRREFGHETDEDGSTEHSDVSDAPQSEVTMF